MPRCWVGTRSEIYSGLPTCFVAPSVLTAYGRSSTGFERLVVGRTVSIRAHAGDRRRWPSSSARPARGVLAMTNEEAYGARQRSTDLTIELSGGLERAVPATKTVTAQMLAVLAIASGFSDRRSDPRARPRSCPDAVADTTDAMQSGLEQAPRRSRAIDRLAVSRARGVAIRPPSKRHSSFRRRPAIMAHGFSKCRLPSRADRGLQDQRRPLYYWPAAEPVDSDTREARRRADAARQAPVVRNRNREPDQYASWRELRPPRRSNTWPRFGGNNSHTRWRRRGASTRTPPPDCAKSP